MDLQILHGKQAFSLGGIPTYNFVITYQSYIAGHSIHIIIQELMNLEISFLPGRIYLLTLSVLMSSVLTNYVSVHVHMYIGTGAG